MVSLQEFINKSVLESFNTEYLKLYVDLFRGYFWGGKLSMWGGKESWHTSLFCGVLSHVLCVKIPMMFFSLDPPSCSWNSPSICLGKSANVIKIWNNNPRAITAFLRLLFRLDFEGSNPWPSKGLCLAMGRSRDFSDIHEIKPQIRQ